MKTITKGEKGVCPRLNVCGSSSTIRKQRQQRLSELLLRKQLHSRGMVSDLLELSFLSLEGELANLTNVELAKRPLSREDQLPRTVNG